MMFEPSSREWTVACMLSRAFTVASSTSSTGGDLYLWQPTCPGMTVSGIGELGVGDSSTSKTILENGGWALESVCYGTRTLGSKIWPQLRHVPSTAGRKLQTN